MMFIFLILLFGVHRYLSQVWKARYATAGPFSSRSYQLPAAAPAPCRSLKIALLQCRKGRREFGASLM